MATPAPTFRLKAILLGLEAEIKSIDVSKKGRTEAGDYIFTLFSQAMVCTAPHNTNAHPRRWYRASSHMRHGAMHRR